MRRNILVSLLMGLALVMTVGCDPAEILGSYPGLTLYFERASNGQPYENVAVSVIDNGSSATTGADGKVTLRVQQQAKSARVHVVFTTLAPFAERTKDFELGLGKGDNYYRIVLQDDPRRPY